MTGPNALLWQRIRGLRVPGVVVTGLFFAISVAMALTVPVTPDPDRPSPAVVERCDGELPDNRYGIVVEGNLRDEGSTLVCRGGGTLPLLPDTNIDADAVFLLQPAGSGRWRPRRSCFGCERDDFVTQLRGDTRRDLHLVGDGARADRPRDRPDALGRAAPGRTGRRRRARAAARREGARGAEQRPRRRRRAELQRALRRRRERRAGRAVRASLDRSPVAAGRGVGLPRRRRRPRRAGRAGPAERAAPRRGGARSDRGR